MRKHWDQRFGAQKRGSQKCGSKDLRPLSIKIWLTKFEYNDKQMEDIPQRCQKNLHF
jgi:hypothetical protein